MAVQALNTALYVNHYNKSIKLSVVSEYMCIFVKLNGSTVAAMTPLSPDLATFQR